MSDQIEVWMLVLTIAIFGLGVIGLHGNAQRQFGLLREGLERSHEDHNKAEASRKDLYQITSELRDDIGEVKNDLSGLRGELRGRGHINGRKDSDK